MAIRKLNSLVPVDGTRGSLAWGCREVGYAGSVGSGSAESETVVGRVRRSWKRRAVVLGCGLASALSVVVAMSEGSESGRPVRYSGESRGTVSVAAFPPAMVAAVLESNVAGGGTDLAGAGEDVAVLAGDKALAATPMASSGVALAVEPAVVAVGASAVVRGSGENLSSAIRNTDRGAGPVKASGISGGGEMLRDAGPEVKGRVEKGGKRKVARAVSSDTKREVIWMEVTAYCPCQKCCGEDAQGVTASGKPVSYNRGRFVAADTDVLPFGTKVVIPGYAGGREVEVIDRGGAIRGNKLDVYFSSHATAKQWGRRRIAVVVVPDEE